jgi:signal peptidase I
MEEAKKDLSLGERIKQSLPLVYLVVGLLALRWTIVEPYVVPTGSMEPTLKTGDRLYALKCAYDVRLPFTDIIVLRTGEVKRGDVILFRAPHDPSITYVKRAVALAGDRIEFRQGVMYVNGQAQSKVTLTERPVMYDIEREEKKTLYLEDLTGVKHYVILNQDPYGGPHRDVPEITVPPDHLFAVGDNRDNSHDSRAWGFVPMQNLKGKGMFIWFSSWDFRPRPERIGTLIQ